MIELLRRFGGKFRRYMVIGPACKLIEVIFDLLTPLVIAQMIDYPLRHGARRHGRDWHLVYARLPKDGGAHLAGHGH